MAEFETALQSDTNAPVILHIVVVAFFMITGTIFNGIILYIQKQKQNRSEVDIYTSTLACVDLFSCLVICPQYPFLGSYMKQYHQDNPYELRKFFTCTVFMMLIYFGLLTAIAFSRVNAVFRPFALSRSTKRSKRVVFVLFWVCLVDALISMNMHGFVHIHSGIEIAIWFMTSIPIPLCLILITISYLAIAIKLYLHSRRFTTKYMVPKDKSREISKTQESSEKT